MDIQKEREAFESAMFKLADGQTKNEINPVNGQYMYGVMEVMWKVWQAAKAQAVPEGFALVSQKDLLELTIAINEVDLATHKESKTNEVREMWQQVALKLMALGAAQEPK